MELEVMKRKRKRGTADRIGCRRKNDKHLLSTSYIPDMMLGALPILSPFYRLRKLRFREVK